MALRLPDNWRARIQQWLKENGHDPEKVAKERERLRESVKRLTKSWINLELTEEEYQSMQEELKQKLSRLVVPQEDELPKSAKTIEQLGELWPMAGPERRRDILRCLLEAIYVDVREKKIVGCDVRADFRLWIASSEAEQA